jgi:hypothetical protein
VAPCRRRSAQRRVGNLCSDVVRYGAPKPEAHRWLTPPERRCGIRVVAPPVIALGRLKLQNCHKRQISCGDYHWKADRAGRKITLLVTLPSMRPLSGLGTRPRGSPRFRSRSAQYESALLAVWFGLWRGTSFHGRSAVSISRQPNHAPAMYRRRDKDGIGLEIAAASFSSSPNARAVSGPRPRAHSLRPRRSKPGALEGLSRGLTMRAPALSSGPGRQGCWIVPPARQRPHVGAGIRRNPLLRP